MTMSTRKKLLLAFLLTSAMAVAGCSSGDDESPTNVTDSADQTETNADGSGDVEGADTDERPLEGEVEYRVEEPDLGENQEMATGEEGRAQNEVLTYESPTTLETTLEPVAGSTAATPIEVTLAVNPREGTACINYNISSAPQVSAFEILRGSVEQGGMLSVRFEVAATTGDQACEELDLDLLNDLATDHEGFYITAIAGDSSQIVFQSSHLGS